MKIQADLNIKLIDAIRHSDEKAVFDLTEAGADPNTYVQENDELSFPNIIKQLWPGTKKNRNNVKMPAILVGMEPYPDRNDPWLPENEKIVRRLIEKGADVNVIDVGGNTPLILSIWRNHSDTAVLLLDRGADVNAANNLGETALILAARSNNISVIKRLIQQGAKVNARTLRGSTALMIAKVNNSHEIFALLKRAGATE